MSADQDATDHRIPPWRLSVALFLLSTATVLFTLALFRLLSFFIMPSLFFDLLFVGFPLGAILGVRYFRIQPTSFQRSLWILQGAMVLSVGATMLCKHFDYLRAHLFDVELHELVIQMGTFTGLFIPFFCAYGLSEYIGYQIGRKNLAGRMSIVYGLYLFGAAFAYVFLELTLSTVGVSRLLCLPVLLIAFASSLLAGPGTLRKILVVEQVILLLGLALPGVAEEGFLQLYKGKGIQSTHAYQASGYSLAFQKWGKYSLTEIMYSEERDEFAGFYNDLMQWKFSGKYGFAGRSLGMIPINFAPEGGSIAILGAGGGRQVKWAQQPRFKFKTILALELEPAVMEAVRSPPLVERFGRVYERQGVEPRIHEARSYLEDPQRAGESFDLIYLPSVGGYPQMMLEPGNMIRTIDAYRTLRNHLTDRGVLAIWYPRGLDPRNILTLQYVRTLESEEIGMRLRAFWNRDDYLILAARSERSRLPEIEELEQFFTRPTGSDLELPPYPEGKPEPFIVLEDPEFSAISDNQPFLAGNVRHIFSLTSVYILFSLVAGLLLVVGLSLLWLLRRAGNPSIPGRSYFQVAGLSFLIGANFLVFEHYVILALFKKLYVFHDSVLLGAISFLVISGLGSTLIRPRWRPLCQLAGALFAVALVFLQPHLSAVTTLVLVAPVAFVTGSFFPALFEAAAKKPLGVFAMDAVGAAWGSVTSFFLPIAFGFHVFFPFASLIFLATAVATYFFFRGGKATSTTPVEPPAGEPVVTP